MMTEAKKQLWLILVLTIVVTIAIASLVVAMISLINRHSVEYRVRQAVLEDMLDGDEDYIVHVEKCDVRSKEYPKAKFFVAWVYTEEDGFQTAIVRADGNHIEVWEQ